MKKNYIFAPFISLCLILFLLTGCTTGAITSSADTSANVGSTFETVRDDTDLQDTEAADTEYLKSGFSVHFIDVGQGDSALILCDGKAMLIDGGKPYASSVIYTYLKKLGIDHLDYIVASHADDDHIGGLSAPLSKIKVGNVLAPKIEADTRAYASFKSKAAEQGLTIQHPKPGDTLTLGSSKAIVIGPITESGDDRNNGSIVLKLVYGDTSFLFTGDAERKEEQQIISSGADLSANVLKVGHHGSENSTTYPFLRKVMPQYAVISVGKDNSYGHPTAEALSRLRDAGVQVYRTDIQGDIIAVSDGKTVTITTSKNKNAITNPTDSEKSYDKTESEQSTDKSNSGGAFDEALTNQGGTAETNREVHDYIVNIKTKKFHYSECAAAKKIPEQNRKLLNCSRDTALADGYTPCGRCKP